MTRAEKTLWRELRQFPIAGSHWRKQAPLGPFIVDFVCHGANVIVELDGGVHRVTEVARRDAERQAWLEGRGYRVLRFTNAEVETNVGAVVRAALAAAEGTPPPPCGEGEGRG